MIIYMIAFTSLFIWECIPRESEWMISHCSGETPERVIANSADPDQTLQNAASDQGLHFLQIVQPFFSQNTCN